ncbi:MAG: GNAT family N-acetyltransferase [Myxococcales bacterium]|nr:MAG: GNAT family N-acetyltransferase [Myxococcales bacterium]
MTDPADLAALVPDLPRHVELRACLLGGDGRVTGFSPDGPSAVVDAGDGTLFVLGEPDLAAVRAALDGGEHGEVIAPPALADPLALLLPGWTRSRIVVHRPSARESLADDGAVQLLDPATLPALALPDELRDELGEASWTAEIAATFVDGAPVSFAYAGAVTERWWDISIDTLEAHRHRGHAAACVSFLIRRERARGREPVWQSVTENPASWRLARKLGFEACDELVFFQRH